MRSLCGVQPIQEFGEVISVLLGAGRCKILLQGTEETQRNEDTHLVLLTAFTSFGFMILLLVFCSISILDTRKTKQEIQVVEEIPWHWVCP